MSKVWFVYGLTCPCCDFIFYVGVTINPKQRMVSHSHDRYSAAHATMRSIIDAGDKPGMVFLGSFPDKDQARHLEARLILSMPWLTNSRSEHTLPSSNLDWRDLRVRCYGTPDEDAAQE